MGKRVSCKDTIIHYTDRLQPHVDCGWTHDAETEEHVLKALRDHTLDVHDIDLDELPQSVRDDVVKAIKDA